ncbi:Chromogranin-A [Bagarius yarrelli]|uniref:Chromogranin-A n=1 Tax=Bagarius yarrelli TaxID=175774 RepID=A0A556V1Y9_BAGYA|nr:Chromogranin-A [Bagarius yarrelli]
MSRPPERQQRQCELPNDPSGEIRVIKCIVEVLADALSKPHSLPVSQQCVETLRTGETYNYTHTHTQVYSEEQIRANERSVKRIEEVPDHAPDLQEPADRSMLTTAQTRGQTLEKRRVKQGNKDNLQEDDIITEEAKKEEHTVTKKTENSEEEGEVTLAEHSRVEEDSLSQEESQSQEESHQEESHQEESHQEAVEKPGIGIGRQRNWSRSEETVHRRVRGQQEAPHHSKEAWKSPEVEELQMMAGREPEERRDLEEGSATKKSEDVEMESLAMMENELENMVQKLHQLRRG